MKRYYGWIPDTIKEREVFMKKVKKVPVKHIVAKIAKHHKIIKHHTEKISEANKALAIETTRLANVAYAYKVEHS